jgi:hypothetical protein
LVEDRLACKIIRGCVGGELKLAVNPMYAGGLRAQLKRWILCFFTMQMKRDGTLGRTHVFCPQKF